MGILDQLGIDFRFILLSFIGFALLVFILTRYAFGPILKTLQARQTTIVSNLDEAQSRRDEMVKLQHQYEDRLAKIEDEARDKVQAAVREAQIARDDIITRARAESDAIFKRGQEELSQERAKMLVESRDQIADLAVNAATKLVKQNLDAGAHARLIDDVIQDLSARNGAVGSAL